MKAIINGEVFIGNKFYQNKVILIDGNRIFDIIDSSLFIDEKFDIIDAKKQYIVPGFIDLQLNGCGGVLFNDSITKETLEIMYKTNLKTGCTSFAPTLITTSDENIEKAIELIQNIKNKENYGILGLHIEGPYISLEKKGIHNPKFIRKANIEMINKIVEAGNDIVKIITLAPENIEKTFISKLCQKGINVAVGHSNATFEELKISENYGVSLATHLYNGMSSFHHRNPGVVGGIFDSDIKAGIIVDGFHSHYSAVSTAIKIMGERLYLVTDAVAPVGTDMEYFYFEGNKVYYKDGKCFGEDGTLGGSALTMDKGIKNLKTYCGVTLEEAIRMATLYPAKAIKIDNEYGKIQKNYYADIVFLNENLNVTQVISKGRLIDEL